MNIIVSIPFMFNKGFVVYLSSMASPATNFQIPAQTLSLVEIF